MEQQAIHKTYKYKLKPTPEQERELERVLMLCLWLYNTALEHRIIAWQLRRVSVSRFEQEAELKDIRAAFPEYAAIHSHVLQDVLARLDKTYQAFFRRVRTGERAGFPRFHGRSRYNSFTYKEFGNGAKLDNGCLVLSTIGRIAVRWSRPLEGAPKTVTMSREADGWYLCVSCVDVWIEGLPATGEETGTGGIDLGIEAFATFRMARASSPLAGIAKPTARSKPRNGAFRAANTAGTGEARQSPCWPRRIRVAGDSGRTFTTRRRWRSFSSTTRSSRGSYNRPTG